LVIDAVAGVTGIVESMHRNISGLAPIVGPPRNGGTKGITGLVYRSVRGVSRMVGFGLDAALAQLAPLLKSRGTSPRREAVLAALNGVLGDYLVASNNPLAISMRLRKDGRRLPMDRQTLGEDFRPGTKLVVLVHGLCMNDLQWHRKGQDHGASLARDLGYTPLYLHYNSGLHISTNGREFADILEQMVREWPVPLRELVVIGHSMGGLVSRSACHYATLAGHAWPRRLKKLVFLGTPHHGAPLERAGNWVDILAGISPYTAPFARLGKIRSAGVKDLRYGNVVDEDWENVGTDHAHDPRKRVPLPRGVQCFAIAATKQLQSGRANTRLRGDGLVPVKSALGRHANAARTLEIPASRRCICYGLSHLDLLGSREVYDRIHRWLTHG
jgi:pimeloyl-ACP methyl ester carboxylesterase